MSNISNFQKYAPPEGYYDRTAGRTHDLLALAMGYLDEGARSALDLGCGAGGETALLAGYGMRVTAVDASEEAGRYIKRLPDQDLIQFVCRDIELFNPERYDLINASFSLPFVHKDELRSVMKGLLYALEPGGIFVGNFFGVNDEWNKPGETMSFVEEDEIRAIFAGLSLLHLDEKEEDGTIADGAPKHWHIYDVIAQKY